MNTNSILLRNLTVWFVAVVGLFSPTLLTGQDWNPPDFDQFGGGNSFGQPAERVTAESYFNLKPDSQLGKVYVEATIAPEWHMYSVTQAKGGPTRTVIKLLDTEEYKIIGPWEPDSEPHIVYDKGFKIDTEQHEGMITWSAPIKFSEGVDAKSVKIEFKFTGQVCDKGGCDQVNIKLVSEYLGEESSEIVEGEVLSTEIEKKKVVHAETEEEIAAMAELYDPESRIDYVKLDGSSGKSTFWFALFGAFVGGMLLNLMPCVFPVLGLKVLGFVEQAGSDPRKIKLHGMAFAGGLIVSMWALAGVILIIKASTDSEVSWGEQMGNPYFVGAIVIMLFVLGLNLAGLFEMGLFMTKVGGGKEKKGYLGSFVSGIITTLVATPCSGPFLGSAMGYTLSQDAMVAMFLFTIFGLGIASPYLLLSFFPSLINWLPRPGAWMETFKKLMAFTLFAAAAFFVKSFGTQTGVEGLSWYLMALCVIALGAFFYGKWSPAYVKASKRYVWGWIAPLLIVGLGGWMYVEAAGIEGPETVHGDGWELWVPGKVESKIAQNKAVWVDYTADW